MRFSHSLLAARWRDDVWRLATSNKGLPRDVNASLYFIRDANRPMNQIVQNCYALNTLTFTQGPYKEWPCACKKKLKKTVYPSWREPGVGPALVPQSIACQASCNSGLFSYLNVALYFTRKLYDVHSVSCIILFLKLTYISCFAVQ